MKDLLDRYLAAIGRELPTAQRSDILAELRDELLTTIESREAAAGRPLTRDELEAVLTEAGHPLVVAGRYRRVQHLVGPDVFPMWWFALKITLAILAGLHLVVAIMRSGFVGGADTSLAANDFLGSAVVAFGVVTLVAVAVEQLNLQHYLYRWRPSQLPPSGVKGKSPFERVVEIGMGAVFLLWWTGLIHFQNTWGPIRVDMARVFSDWFWPILAYGVADTTVSLIGLVRPGWVRLNAALSVIRSIAAFGVGAGLLQAGHWLVIGSDVLPPEALAGAQERFDLGFKLGLVVTLAGLALAAVIDAFKLWRVIQDDRAPYAARA